MKFTPVDHDPFAFRPVAELPQSVADQGYSVAHVKIGDVDREWQKDDGYYIHPNDERDGKLTKAKHYILSDAKKFEVPLLGVHPHGSEAGNVGFDDGRHRFAAARDLGYDSMPVGMDPESLKNARDRGLLAEQPSSPMPKQPWSIMANAAIPKIAAALGHDLKIVPVNVDAVDSEWKKDRNFYVGNEPENVKLQRAKEFIKSEPERFEVPEMGVRKNGGVYFDDGRHRFAAARELGHSTVPVAMDPESMKNARERGFLVE